MDVLIIKHIETEGPGLIEHYLRREKIPFQIKELKSGANFPPPSQFTHLVLLGGPMNVYEEDCYPFLRSENLFIKEAIRKEKTILGICLGAQLIAKALGAKIFRSPVKEIGWYDISLTRMGSRDNLFGGLPERFPVFQWHEDTFEIPKTGKLIATSRSVPHQGFRYGKNIYGLQFHLEVTEGMIRDWMKTYGEESGETQHPLASRSSILIETETNIETYTRRGITFLENFFKRAQPGSDLIS